MTTSATFLPELHRVQNYLRERAGLDPLPDPGRDMLMCSCCGAWRPDDDFYRNKRETNRRGRGNWCKSCSNAYKTEWRERPENKKRDNERRRLARLSKRGELKEGVLCVCGTKFHKFGLVNHRRACKVWLDSERK